MPPRKRGRATNASVGFASPPNRGRVSARLQSLYTGDARPGDGIDFVRASRHLKPRRWEKKPKVIGGVGPQAFTVPRWQPVGPPSAELMAIRDRPPPSVKRSKKRKLDQDRTDSPVPLGDERAESPSASGAGESTADIFNDLAARHAEDPAKASAAADDGGARP